MVTVSITSAHEFSFIDTFLISVETDSNKCKLSLFGTDSLVCVSFIFRGIFALKVSKHWQVSLLQSTQSVCKIENTLAESINGAS